MPAPTLPTAIFPPADPMASLNQGLGIADAEAAAKAGRQPDQVERDDVARWMQDYKSARDFDADARARYALDRKYARGDSGFLVDANIIGTNVDILEAFLYARNPEFNVTPGRAMKPPSAETLRDAIEDSLYESPEIITAMKLAEAQAKEMGMNPMQVRQSGEQARLMMIEGEIKSQLHQQRRRYSRRQRDMKAFAETCELIGGRMWEDGKLKVRGVKMVRSGLTVALGVLKASWQQRTEVSPEHRTAINDLVDNLARARALKYQMEKEGGTSGVNTATYGNEAVPQDATVSYSCDTNDALIADYERQLKDLREQNERVTERGFVIDSLEPENFQVAPGFTIDCHTDAPWNADATFIAVKDAIAFYGEYLRSKGYNPEQIIGQAVKYAPRKPQMVQGVSPLALETDGITGSPTRPEDADAFATSMDNTDAGAARQWFVKVIEFWDRTSNTVLTGIEGVKCWVKPAWTPPPTTRFYPYFVWCVSMVDGQRHPQSLVTRSMKLVDEYNRIGSAETEHRRRILPKTAFDAGMVPQTEAEKLEKARIGEMVALKLTQPGTPLSSVLWPVTYPQMDQQLYDRQRITNEIERIWGIQEALSGSKDYEQTATEAEIQQSGFNARTSSRRDSLDWTFTQLAQYTIEIARKYVTAEDAEEIVGPDAFWPEYGGPNDVVYTVNISVRAGSSGKPNTTRERQAWSELLPILQSNIVQIGQLRGASNEQIADSLEELLKITAERSGERIDVEGLIPRGDGAMGLAGIAGPSMPGGPQPGGAPTPGGAVPPGAGGPVPPGAAADVSPGPPGGTDPLSPAQQPTTFA